MASEDRLVFVGTSDLGGIVRGKSFPKSEWEKRLIQGVGWMPTNAQITCFDTISDSPFGSLGDLALVPDPQTHCTIDTVDRPMEFVLGDICHLDGQSWSNCTRSLARRAISAFHQTTGAMPLIAFEHEFQLKQEVARPGDAFGLKGFRDAQAWAESLLAALRQTPCKPDTFMKEYGPSQYELTNKPATGITAADNAVILRALTHDILGQFGVSPSFSPVLDPKSVGNGVHIHLSFIDDNADPVTYDPRDPHGMSRITRHFIGGILQHLDQLIAILAPSAISYLRLVPHRWSAAFNNLGYRDREASVRICPTSGKTEQAIAQQFNFEVRAIDAAASPYLALAALMFAGTQGIRDKTEPPSPTQEDLSLLTPQALEQKGFKRLPESLEDALGLLNASEAVRSWFGDEFIDLYVAHKRGEIEQLDGLDWAAKCKRYGDVY